MTDPIIAVDARAAPQGVGAFGVSAAAPAVAPSAVAASSTAAAPSPPPSLQTALQELGRKFQDAGVDVTFSIDQQLDRVIVKVVDSRDGTVLRQIPSEDVLRLARAMSPSGGTLLQEVV